MNELHRQDGGEHDGDALPAEQDQGLRLLARLLVRTYVAERLTGPCITSHKEASSTPEEV